MKIFHTLFTDTYIIQTNIQTFTQQTFFTQNSSSIESWISGSSPLVQKGGTLESFVLNSGFLMFSPQCGIHHFSSWLLRKGAPHRSDWNFTSVETKRTIGCTLEAMLFDARIETDKSVNSLRHLQLNPLRWKWRMLKTDMKSAGVFPSSLVHERSGEVR